jgi:hypothetical protein
MAGAVGSVVVVVSAMEVVVLVEAGCLLAAVVVALLESDVPLPPHPATNKAKANAAKIRRTIPSRGGTTCRRRSGNLHDRRGGVGRVVVVESAPEWAVRAPIRSVLRAIAPFVRHLGVPGMGQAPSKGGLTCGAGEENRTPVFSLGS